MVSVLPEAWHHLRLAGNFEVFFFESQLCLLILGGTESRQSRCGEWELRGTAQ